MGPAFSKPAIAILKVKRSHAISRMIFIRKERIFASFEKWFLCQNILGVSSCSFYDCGGYGTKKCQRARIACTFFLHHFMENSVSLFFVILGQEMSSKWFHFLLFETSSLSFCSYSKMNINSLVWIHQSWCIITVFLKPYIILSNWKAVDRIFAGDK